MKPSNKSLLEALLKGKPIGMPPHFELVFQLPEEAFGIRPMSWDEWQKASPAEQEREVAKGREISARLVDEYGWAAVAGDTAQLKKDLGDRALVYAFNGQGTFWLMPGSARHSWACRRAPSNSSRKISTFHFPPITASRRSTSHSTLLRFMRPGHPKVPDCEDYKQGHLGAI